MLVFSPGARPSTLGRVIGAGGSNTAPGGWMVMINRGCWPICGTIGTLSACTWVTEIYPSLLPSGKVTEFALIVNSKPGTPGIVYVTSAFPPTRFALARSRGTRYIRIPTVLSAPAIVVISYINFGYSITPGVPAVVPSAIRCTGPTGTLLTTN